ncbi:plasma-membrane calcium-translocating P-type ATPase [Glaciecola sp. KUL10]|nr:plasma-membrane calcium-translocating P-type ATPase [Glaciecola sp. KUL10]
MVKGALGHNRGLQIGLIASRLVHNGCTSPLTHEHVQEAEVLIEFCSDCDVLTETDLIGL